MATETTMAALWSEHGRSKRGPKPRMTIERIVETAIGLADREGMESVSMQRLADELDATKMSLYRYTPGKAELTALMLDTAMGQLPDLAETDWRAGLTAWALAMHAAFTRHPWALQVAVGARVLGPNELDWMEVGLTFLEATPLNGAERFDALALIAGHVRGIVQQSIAPGRKDVSPERGVDQLMGEILAANAGRYPRIISAFASARDSDGQDNALAFGLERILDGLGAAIAAQSRRRNCATIGQSNGSRAASPTRLR